MIQLSLTEQLGDYVHERGLKPSMKPGVPELLAKGTTEEYSPYS
jgi:hypothetical protein